MSTPTAKGFPRAQSAPEKKSSVMFTPHRLVAFGASRSTFDVVWWTLSQAAGSTISVCVERKLRVGSEKSTGISRSSFALRKSDSRLSGWRNPSLVTCEKLAKPRTLAIVRQNSPWIEFLPGSRIQPPLRLFTLSMHLRRSPKISSRGHGALPILSLTSSACSKPILSSTSSRCRLEAGSSLSPLFDSGFFNHGCWGAPSDAPKLPETSPCSPDVRMRLT